MILDSGQQRREQLLFDLQKMLQTPTKEEVPLLQTTLFWLHFTDWYNWFDLDVLIEEGLVILTKTKYKPDGSWRDNFPPSCYMMTDKAEFILAHPGLWVYEGKFSEVKESR